MGRAKREVPTGKLQLKYPKTNFDKSKEYTLNYYYSYNRKTMTKDTGYRVRVGDWNQAGNNGKGAVRPSYGSDYARVNNRLDDFRQGADQRSDQSNTSLNDERDRVDNRLKDTLDNLRDRRNDCFYNFR